MTASRSSYQTAAGLCVNKNKETTCPYIPLYMTSFYYVLLLPYTGELNSLMNNVKISFQDFFYTRGTSSAKPWPIT